MSNNTPPFIGRFWRMTSRGIFLYWHTGYKTVARFNVTKQEAIEWEQRMTAKEKRRNETK